MEDKENIEEDIEEKSEKKGKIFGDPIVEIY